MAQPNNSAPDAPYLASQPILRYIAKLHAGSNEREDQADHAMANILPMYFPLPDYTVERESYVSRESACRANIAVAHVPGASSLRLDRG